MAELARIYEAIVQGSVDDVVEEAETQISLGTDPMEIVSVLLKGIQYVGDEFKSGRYFVPEVMISARAMNAGMAVVRPYLSNEAQVSSGTVVIGTVKGDLHDIGKNLVAMMLEAGGFKVVNLGCDVDASAYIEAVLEHHAEILGLSALLTTTMLEMNKVIELLEEKGIRDQVQVIVGGAPLTQDYADRIGADGFSYDASGAVELCKKIIEGREGN